MSASQETAALHLGGAAAVKSRWEAPRWGNDHDDSQFAATERHGTPGEDRDQFRVSAILASGASGFDQAEISAFSPAPYSPARATGRGMGHTRLTLLCHDLKPEI